MPMEGCQAEVVLHFTKWDTPTPIKSQPHLCVYAICRHPVSQRSRLAVSIAIAVENHRRSPDLKGIVSCYFLRGSPLFLALFRHRNERSYGMKGDFVHFLNIVMGKVFEESVASILIWHFENVLRDRELFVKVFPFYLYSSIRIVV